LTIFASLTSEKTLDEISPGLTIGLKGVVGSLGSPSALHFNLW
jgi:hypothetical protein